ncbi:MAG: carbonic anhydrase [Verrucomicrobiota bacterium]
MKKFIGVLALIGLVCLSSYGSDAANPEKLTRMLQQSTLTLLKEGNIRYAEGKSFHPNIESSRRTELAAAGQEPMATVLACSDSRDPVELIFDRGVGDLFVVRVAGNTAGLSELATMEYGVTHLGTPVLIVMGHTKCGAVTAAVKGAELHGHLPSLISLIKPAAEKARISATEEDLVPRAIELNVWQQVENIFSRSALVREFAAAGKVTIIGAVYDIASGKVQWLGQHPEIDRLVAEAKASVASVESAHDSAPAHPPVAATPPAAPTTAPAPNSMLIAPAVPSPTAPGTHAEPAPKTASTTPAKQAKSHLPPAAASTPTSANVTRTEVANSHH